MDIAPISDLSSDSNFISWLNSFSEVSSVRVVNALPWREDCLLETGNGIVYLRRTTPERMPGLKLNENISRYFEKCFPTVLSSSEDFNAILVQEQDAIVFGDKPSEKQRLKLIQNYASLQLASQNISRLSAEVESLDLDTLLVSLLDFLNPEYEYSNGGVNAGFYMHDVREARGYHAAISSRVDLIQRILSDAARLPSVLNHCHLDPMGVYEKHDGTIVIDHWEHARMGPAGLSLPKVFGSCSSVLKLLMENDRDSHDGKLLCNYLDALSNNHYADMPLLAAGIPAAAFAGVMNQLVSLSTVGIRDFDYCKTIAGLIRDGIEDLVHYCDELVLYSGRDAVLHYTNDYVVNGAPWRGASLLERWLEDHPADTELCRILLDINIRMANWQSAIAAAEQLLILLPGDPEIHHLLGIAHLKYGQPLEALKAFEVAERSNPQMPELKHNIEKCSQIIFWQDRAKIPHLAPTLSLTDQERTQNVVASEKVDLATRMFREYGYTVIQNVFDKNKIEEISQAVFERYNNYFEDRFYEDNLILGDKRRMVTLDINDVFNDPTVYGSPIIDGMMGTLLNEDYVLGGFNAVVSLPGSRDQGLHKDYAPLFPNDAEEYFVTPPFAAAVLIPLIKMSYQHGVTSFRKGSQKVPEQMPFHIQTQEPLVDLGDCVVFDYRVAHEGLANHTEDVRPMLSMIYHRIWFRDALNYEQQVPVSITKPELEKVPEPLKHLFKWVDAC
ncbi:MAG: phytanoyl-CoA dioxygenase family protein [Thiolinea sp.]